MPFCNFAQESCFASSARFLTDLGLEVNIFFHFFSLFFIFTCFDGLTPSKTAGFRPRFRQGSDAASTGQGFRDFNVVFDASCCKSTDLKDSRDARDAREIAAGGLAPGFAEACAFAGDTARPVRMEALWALAGSLRRKPL
jgi:hypothetical protein